MNPARQVEHGGTQSARNEEKLCLWRERRLVTERERIGDHSGRLVRT